MASEGQNKPPELSNRADVAPSANHAVMAAAAYPNSHEWPAMFPYVWPGQVLFHPDLYVLEINYTGEGE